MGVILYAEPLEEKTAQKTVSSSKWKCYWGSHNCFLQRSKGSPAGVDCQWLSGGLSVSSDYKEPSRKRGQAVPTKQRKRQDLSDSFHELYGLGCTPMEGWSWRGKQSHFLMISHWDSKTCECLAWGYRIQFREKEKCLVSGSCLIIRLGVWSRAKNCGIDNTKWANSGEDRKVDFRTKHLLLQISQTWSSQLPVRTPPSHLWLFWAPLIHAPEELSTPSAVISTCFIPFWRCPSSVYAQRSRQQTSQTPPVTCSLPPSPGLKPKSSFSLT